MLFKWATAVPSDGSVVSRLTITWEYGGDTDRSNQYVTWTAERFSCIVLPFTVMRATSFELPFQFVAAISVRLLLAQRRCVVGTVRAERVHAS